MPPDYYSFYDRGWPPSKEQNAKCALWLINIHGNGFFTTGASHMKSKQINNFSRLSLVSREREILDYKSIWTMQVQYGIAYLGIEDIDLLDVSFF